MASLSKIHLVVVVFLSFSASSQAAGTPPAPTQLSPANGSINSATSLSLTWRQEFVAPWVYHVELASDSLFANILLNDSNLTDTTQTITGLSNNTQYFWRENGAYSTGSAVWLSPWSPAWKFTTIPLGIPSTPTLLSPAQSDSNVATSTLLSWNADSGASSYRVQLATDSLFSNFVVNDSGLTTNSQAVGPLTNSSVYYWRVIASNLNGSSFYSTIFNFKTVQATPSIPVLTSPPNGSVNISTTTSLNWTASTNTVSYVCELSSDPNFQSYLVYDSNLTATSLVVGPLPNSGTFYWRVKGTYFNSTSSAWSPIWSYTTAPNAPAAPLILTPAQNASNIFDSTTFTWLGFVNGKSYDLQIAVDSIFTEVFVNDTGLNTTSLTARNLPNGFTLYWRVNATGPGGISAWSNTGIFTTLTSAGIFNRPVQKSILKNGVFGGQVILDNRMVNGVKEGF